MLILPIVNKKRVVNVEIKLKNASKIRKGVCFDDAKESEIIVNREKFSDSSFKDSKEENAPKKYGDKEYTAYEATQQQRKMERTMRKLKQDIKLLKEGDGSDEDIGNTETKYRTLSEEYVKFSKAMGLPQQRERIFNINSLKIKPESSIKGLGAKGDNAEVPPHDSPKLLEAIDYNNEKQIEETISKYEDIIRNDVVENAIVILKTGEVYRCYGDEEHVWPNKDLEGLLEDAYITHNHPKAVTEYSFSSDDIALFFDEKYIYELNRNFEEKEDEYLEKIFENALHAIVLRKAQLLKFGYERWKNNERQIKKRI